MRDIILAVYIFLPAGVANATPPLLTRFLGPGRAIDRGRSWRGKPMFGSHKTWQGLIGGTLAGVLTFLVQRDLDHIELPLSFGIAISAGALLGDLVKSFFKRRLAFESGRAWFPFDQLDYVIGGLAAGSLFVRLPWNTIATIVVAYFVLHLLVSALGYAVGVKTAPL